GTFLGRSLVTKLYPPMALINLRVLDGADRGRVFENLTPPITIGREEGNAIQLNDDRVSRFHIKIQEDDNQLVLTDLESTNGTRVNGEDIQLRILRFGDLISVGRSVLLFGSRDEIAGRLADLRSGGPTASLLDHDQEQRINEACSLDFELNWSGDQQDLQATLHVLQPPQVPRRLSPGQAAQLSELIEYLHVRIRRLIESVRVDERAQPERLTVALREWQNLLDLQARLATYLHEIGNPGHEE
ncbi:MAG: FHA domain-containing protein, partial [Planctomycetales bacterium]|nr:FHA domain-containing protein [Planctomycetales bacterium]